MSRTEYYVDKRRNFDGLSNWTWVLWIDDYAWDSYDSEAEAWAAAEQHHAGEAETNKDERIQGQIGFNNSA